MGGRKYFKVIPAILMIFPFSFRQSRWWWWRRWERKEEGRELDRCLSIAILLNLRERRIGIERDFLLAHTASQLLYMRVWFTLSHSSIQRQRQEDRLYLVPLVLSSSLSVDFSSTCIGERTFDKRRTEKKQTRQRRSLPHFSSVVILSISTKKDKTSFSLRITFLFSLCFPSTRGSEKDRSFLQFIVPQFCSTIPSLELLFLLVTDKKETPFKAILHPWNSAKTTKEFC